MGELATRIRAKYPGAYDSLSDGDLESKVMAKYPGVYDHLVSTEKTSKTPMLPSHSATTAMPERPMRAQVAEYIRPLLEGLGTAGGAIIGGGGGGLAGLAGGPAAPGTVPYGAITGGIAGAGLGYASGSTLADIIAGKPAPAPGETAKKIMSGASYEMGGQAIGPTFAMLGRGVARTGGALSDYASGALGISTGTSGHMIKEATRGTPEFAKFMRSEEHGGEQLVNMAKNAISSIKSARNAAYQTSEQQLFANSPAIPQAPQILEGAFTESLKKFRATLKPIQDETGNVVDYAVDTVGSKIGKASAGAVKETYSTIKQWAAKQDYSAESLDALRMQLDDLYKNGEFKSNVFIKDMRDSIAKYMEGAVPGYKAMKSAYAKESEFLNNLNRTLSLRAGTPIDTTVRKLTQAMRDNFEFRKDLLTKVQDATGVNLEGAIAGYNMSSWRPRGVSGKISQVGLGFGSILTNFSPQFMVLMASTSPRVVGETMRAMGATTQQAAKVASRFKALKAFARSQPGMGGVVAGSKNIFMTPVEQQILTNEENK